MNNAGGGGGGGGSGMLVVQLERIAGQLVGTSTSGGTGTVPGPTPDSMQMYILLLEVRSRWAFHLMPPGVKDRIKQFIGEKK